MILNFELKIKIHNLLTSIKALDIHLIENLNKFHLYIKDQKNKQKEYTLQLSSYYNHPKYYKKCHPEENIKNIYLIHQLLNNTHIQNIIKIIINNYSKSILCPLTQQYFRKFGFLYNKTNIYYNISSHYLYNTTEEIAITNLYILYKITQNAKTEILIKYLRK